VPVLALRIEFIRRLSDRAAFGDLARQPVNDGLVVMATGSSSFQTPVAQT
jgi:hypothetical protein